MLFAGTETGIYFSLNNGSFWQSLKLNLPVTPVHDLQIQKRENDLVIATHGRSFWILDDITPLYQVDDAAHADVYFYQPRAVVRKRGGSYYNPAMQEGENAPTDLLLRYY